VAQQEAIPRLHIIAEGIDGSTLYCWEVTMLAPDATGRRILGYRASGTIQDDLTGIVFKKGPEVHDENLPRWTPMNPTDRPDIRREIAQKAASAVKRLRASGQNTFQHLLP
jgi:hypothetical protein